LWILDGGDTLLKLAKTLFSFIKPLMQMKNYKFIAINQFSL